MTPHKHVIGIVGGMGPQAGNALFDRITALTHASKDQDHHSVILMSLPSKIVDRTAFLTGSIDENPGYAIADIICKLEGCGATVVGIACNTSHSSAIFNVIMSCLEKRGSKVKLLSMPEETCRLIAENYPRVRRVALMTTNGTYRTQLYEQMVNAGGMEAIVPDVEFQNDVIHRMIYDPKFGIKANPAAITDQARNLLRQAITFFKKQNADAIILGCTELSLMISQETIGEMVVVDSTIALAKGLIREAVVTKRSPVQPTAISLNA
jgi:aspartate racemase